MLVKNLVATVCVATAIGFTLVSDAHAGWGSSGGSWGSSGGSSGGSWGSRGSSGGSWGSSGGSSGGSWGSRGSSGGSWGGSRGSSGGSSGGGLFSRLHARFHCQPRVVYSSSGGSSGSYGGSSGQYYSGGSSGQYYSGGSSGGAVYSGGSTGAYYGGSTGTTVIDSQYAPIIVNPANSAPTNPPAPPVRDDGAAAGEDPTSLNDGLLTIDLPSDAKVFVNGVETKTPGSHREYVSRSLDSNVDYAYDVKAIVVRNGQTMEENRKVTVRAGKTTRLNFDFASEAVASEKVETKLTVKVPEGAKVFLSGNATNATGETRVYRTKALKAGEAWENYIVRVSHVVNGQTLSKEQHISLTAGDERELSFDFNEASLADAR